MMELWRHIGQDCDVPAGDIGVGGREIGYMFGMYKKLRNDFQAGVLTGKGLSYGGSLIRPEATGYGLVYFAREMLATKGKSFEGATVSISGSGNVAQFACEKVLDLGGVPVTMSDSSGWIHDPAGIDREKLAWIMDLKTTEEAEFQNTPTLTKVLPSQHQLQNQPQTDFGELMSMLPYLALHKMN